MLIVMATCYVHISRRRRLAAAAAEAAATAASREAEARALQEALAASAVEALLKEPPVFEMWRGGLSLGNHL